MTQFKYTAKKSDGKTTTSTMRANTVAEVSTELKRQGMTLLSASEVKQAKSGFAALFQSKPKPAKRIKMEELVVFTRQLSTMISAGIPLLESLEVLQEQTDNMGFKLVLASIVEKVRIAANGGVRFLPLSR
ncbi:MAG: type II secretion system F family protein [Planctomycetes bacterium]|nr:type II secretion system F family protein [Planctomycetota bacterium]